jgi:hypothetical protein
MNIIVEALSANSIQWKGAVFEVFIPLESAGLVIAAGDRLRCLYVEQTNQVFALEKIA